MVKGKNIVIIAGPNGAGKTTFAKEFLPNEADLSHLGRGLGSPTHLTAEGRWEVGGIRD